MAEAVIRSGGKQFRVAEGDRVRIPTLAEEPGNTVAFDVLAISGEVPKIGAPLVKGAKVEAEVVSHGLDKKLVVFKFKRRKRYRRKMGHRQKFTEVKITKITG